MQAALLILSVLCALLLGAAVAMLVALLRRRGLSADELPRPASPEALADTERRIAEQVTRQLAALELKAAEQAKAQRDELGGTLRSRFEENARLLDGHLREVRARIEAMGEMRASFERLGAGVARFNALLANVKARGTWGEVQLDKLLEDMLVPGQFGRNVKPNPRSAKIVEFALALPGQEEGKTVWLPIDSKFPVEDYERLLAATDEASAEAARRALHERLRLFATQVKEYITPPHTTDFAVLFLPTDGLYLETASDPSTMDDLRRKHIMLAGPQTLAALLNALQMGFRTLAVQKQAAKAWDLLVKAKRNVEEFLNHCDTIDKKLDDAHKAVDDARGRVSQLSRNLRSVTLPEEETTDA